MSRLILPVCSWPHTLFEMQLEQLPDVEAWLFRRRFWLFGACGPWPIKIEHATYERRHKPISKHSRTNGAQDHPQLYLVINDALPWQYIERALRRHCFLLAYIHSCRKRIVR
jgi:hypothetical protein